MEKICQKYFYKNSKQLNIYILNNIDNVYVFVNITKYDNYSCFKIKSVLNAHCKINNICIRIYIFLIFFKIMFFFILVFMFYFKIFSYLCEHIFVQFYDNRTVCALK